MKYFTLTRMTANLAIHMIVTSSYLTTYHLVKYNSVTIDMPEDEKKKKVKSLRKSLQNRNYHQHIAHYHQHIEIIINI